MALPQLYLDIKNHTYKSMELSQLYLGIKNHTWQCVEWRRPNPLCADGY